ncbi:obscurin isoform X8 [Pungitius pungitius]|uniref:obscurin isoform X8 n=1 Tax=Pungitius pungitius TaxID=134920 RepID=UPI002E0FAE02
MLIATSPRLSSDQEKKSTEEAYQVEVDCMTPKCHSGSICGNRGETQTGGQHSRLMPTSQSTNGNLTDWMTTKPPMELPNNQQTTNTQSPVYSNSVKPTIIQSDTNHHTNKTTESQGEEFIYYIQHAKASTEELDNSLETEELCTLQTAAVESEESAVKNLIVQSEKIKCLLEIPTAHSALGSLLHSLTAQSQHISTVKSNKFCDSLKTASLQSQDLVQSVHTGASEEPPTFSHTATVQSEEAPTFSHTATVQSEGLCSSTLMQAGLSKKLVDCAQTEKKHSEGPFKSLRTANVQSEEPCTYSQGETVQAKKPCTFSHTATVKSEELGSSTQMLAVMSKKLLECVQMETFQSEEACNSFRVATAQSKDPSKSLQGVPARSSQTATVKSGEALKSSCSETVQSEETFKSVQIPTLQSEDTFKSLKSAMVQSKELFSSIQMQAVLSEERIDCSQTEFFNSEGSINSLLSATNQSVDLNTNQQMTNAHSEKLSALRNTVYPQLLDSKDAGMVRPRRHHNLQQLTYAGSDDLQPTGQISPHHTEELYQSKHAQPGHSECHHSVASEDQIDSRVTAWQRSSTQCAEPHCIKQASTVQSDKIYLSRTCDNHWSESVTANKVAVEAPPVRVTTLCEAERNKSVVVDEPIVLQCEISDPKAQVNWYKDGISLREAAGQDMLAEGSIRTLAIQSAMLSHAGTYSCKTTDDALQFHVDVKAPLVKFSALSEGDQKQTVMAGFPIVLQCELSDPTGQVSWYKDGTKLPPKKGVDLQSEGNVRSLVVPTAEPAHSGVYRCESKDDDIQFAVEVKALPVKFSELQETDKSKSVQEGSPIVLSCELSHDPSARVDWYKDGSKLLPKNNMEIQSDGLTRTLLIHSAENVDGGTYECSTSDDTVTFTVNVEGRSPEIMPIPLSEKYKMVAMGCPIILQCEVSDTVAQVSWFKDEVELFSKTGLDMKRDGSLRKLMIHSAKVSDSGIYSCSLAEDVVTFQVDVEASPVRFSELPEIARNKFIEAGCPIKLQCEVSEPTAQVYWHKDGEQLPPKSEDEIQIQARDRLRALVITSAEVRHCGVYSCEAADDRIEFKVDVAALTEAERSKSVEAGSLINLQCETADQTGQSSRCEDGIKVSQNLGTNMDSEDDKRTLAMMSATSSSSGVYGCKTNDDSDSNDFYVEVKAPLVTFGDIPEEDLFKSVVEQEPFVLSCEVSWADAVVQWYKDGMEMQPCNNIAMRAEGTKRNVTVNAARLSDGGTYTCRAGDNVLMYKVTIREPPVLIIYPKEDVHLDRHVPEEIILSCELSRPNGVVSWYKDGQKLQESENIKLKIEGPYRRLKIISSGVEDSGEYVCDTADASIFFQLSITEPPVQIVSPSQSQMELCQQTSERMVLSCEISRPNAVVRWYRDGLEVEENDNLLLEVDGVYRRLIIPETTVKDSAEYVCDTADDSMTFFVNIAEAPVRFVRPRKMASRVEKVAGETLVLDCEVSRSNAEVTWKRNGEEVEDSRKITILEDGFMRQLTVHSLTMGDAGQYVCDAKDDVMDFHVKVQDLPVKILGKTDAKNEKQFLVYDDIILVCELSRSNAAVSWYKDNQLIDDTERYCSEHQGVFRSLVVLNAGLEDSGEYTCDAVDDKMIFYITVKEPQVQIIGNSGHPEHHILVAGDDLILECEVSRPNASVQWLWNGEILKPDTRIKIDSYDVVRKLVLSGLRPSDSGNYICDAVDDKLTTIVEVHEPMVKFENKRTSNNLSAYENESVTMCAVVSHERANIRWLKEGQLLNGDNIHISSEGNTHKLTINPLQLSDSGEYVCDAKTDEMYFSLLVKEMKVKFLRPLENTVSQKGSAVILRCEINKPKGDVQWLKDGQEISPSRRHTIRAQGRERSFTLHQLVEGDAGEYSCQSTDDRTSATVTVETPRVVEFIAELHNTTVREGEDAVFKCVVSPEDARLVWRLNGKRVALTKRTVISSNGLCHMLCIHNCMVSDSGRVTADAEGSVSEAELQIQEQQVLFTKKMTPVVAEECSEATLEVEVSLDSGEVQWMRQGVLIHPGVKNILNHNGRKHSLTIHKLALSDRGLYSCETLHDRTQAHLTVEPRKITIKRGLTDIKTTERETASLEVELSHPDVSGTWTRNAVKLKPTNHFRMSAKELVHSLTISNLSVEDTGTFTFSVDNVKTSARLVVKEPPVTVFRKLEDQRFPEGAVISLECELSRHNLDVKWMKNGLEVKPGKDLRIYAMGRKRFLQIMKCNVGDSGTYTCDAGDVTTSCTVDVYERELLILQAPKDLGIQEDQNAVFVCELSVEDVPGEWYKNGERIQPTSTIKIRQEGTKHFLLMCNVKAEDSGEIKFVCRSIESVAYLEVEELPVNIVKPLQDTTALEKSRVLLDCTVSNPRCSIRWYKGSSVILPSERFEICSEGCYRKLILQQVVLDDEGTYSVQVGEHSCSAKLTVEARSPLLVRELRDVEVTAPDPACFECELSGPVLRGPAWSLKGEPLQPGPRVLVETMGAVHRLTLRQTSPDMSGEVGFTSGGAKSRAQLRVIRDLGPVVS